MNQEIINKFNKIKLLVMDIDGTLTDGYVYYGNEGELFKKFSVRDGMGITLIHKNDIQTAFLTSEKSIINSKRALKLGINFVIQGTKNKLQSLHNLSRVANIEMDNIAFVGDDINDYHALKIAGLSIAPANSVDSIKEIVDYVTINKGGDGAIREICEIILNTQEKSLFLEENW